MQNETQSSRIILLSDPPAIRDRKVLDAKPPPEVQRQIEARQAARGAVRNLRGIGGDTAFALIRAEAVRKRP